VYKLSILIENTVMELWEIVFLLPFAFGLYVFAKAPLSQRYHVPSWADPVSGFVLTIVSVSYFYFAYFSSEMGPAFNVEPCRPLSKQLECYTLNEDTCRAAWASSYGNCGEKLENILKTRPSFLTGTFLDTCVGKNFDKMMHYNRKNKSSASCQTYFSKIDKKD
jgi:hypothetical protein